MEEVTASFLSRMIHKTQERIENHFFEARKNVLEYDDVLNAQREHIYGLRREILLGKDVRAEITQYVRDIIPEMVENAWMVEEDGSRVYDHAVLFEDLSEMFPIVDYATIADLEKHQPGPELVGYVQDIVAQAYQAKIAEVGEDNMREMERLVLLQAVNDRWMDHLQVVEYIREGIGLRGYGQVDPLVAYKRETYDTFQLTLKNIRDQASKLVFHVRPRARVSRDLGLSANLDQLEMDSLTPEDTEEYGQPVESATQVLLTPAELERVDWKRVGRNDPCPCGSGKKFKECHYKNLRADGVI
jgi:preprotein translocase subunit SecA